MILQTLENAKYPVILADPPWEFVTWSKKNQTRAAENHYPVLTFDDLLQFPMKDLLTDDGVLFLWTIDTLLPQIFSELLPAWGIEARTKAFTWVKLKKNYNPEDMITTEGDVNERQFHFGLGYYTRANPEDCWLCAKASRPDIKQRRGIPGRPAKKNVRQLIVKPVGEHSSKPNTQYERVEELYPGPYLELFSRRCRPGWDHWGIDVGSEPWTPPPTTA